MKKLLPALLLVGFASAAAAQPPTRVKDLTPTPVPPNREMLRRMDMDMRWHRKIAKIDEIKDGVVDVRLIRGRAHPQLVVQTVRGEVILVDGESGDILWRTAVRMAPASQMLPAVSNSHSIYIVRKDLLYILDRDSGAKMLWIFDPIAKERLFYGFKLYDELPQGQQRTPAYPPLAKPYDAPTVDEDGLYYTAGDRIIALNVPNYTREKLPDNGSSLKPRLRWILFPGGTAGIKHTPIVTQNQVGFVKVDGTFQSLEKNDEFIRFTYKVGGRVGASIGLHTTYEGAGRTLREKDAIAYLCSEDNGLYAIDLIHKEEPLLWRFLASGPLRRKPYVNDRDVYVKAENGSFYRVDRSDGREKWANKQALQFMAANRSFVYTRDKAGSLLIHDYLRGTTLAEWDFRDWRMSVPNELTDRIYLAHSDGQIMCLHNHDYTNPFVMKTVPLEIPLTTLKSRK